MASLDYIILIPLLYFGYRGFRNGIIHEVLNLVGLVLAVFVSFYYMDPFARQLGTILNSNSPYITLLSGATLFIGVLLATLIASKILWRFFKLLHLNLLNRAMGTAFGLLKGGLLLSAIFLLLAGIDLPAPETRSSSSLYPYVIKMAPTAYDIVASALPGIEDFRQTITQAIENKAFIKEFFNH